MKYRFFDIPVQGGADAQEEFNHFLAAHRVAAVHREFAAEGRLSLWCFCVTYLDGEGPVSPQARGKVDYREVLSESDFAVYAKLRALRKELSDRDGIPAYALFTNEQLADLVRQRVTSVAALEGINGVGKARVEKYGPAFLSLLRDVLAEAAPGAAGA